MAAGAREVLGGNGVLIDHHVTGYTNHAEAIYSFEGPVRSTR